MEQSTIEERLTALERQMEELKLELARKRQEGNWIEKIAGSFKDDPAFDEAMRLGAEFRRAQRPTEDE